ncbi:MAG: hypothetical protein AAF171_05170 [Cyanobacteria bacterium P01_A01_bin.116]
MYRLEEILADIWSRRITLRRQTCVSSRECQLKEIEVYRREDTRLQKVATLLMADMLTSPLLPGLNAL